MLLQQVDVYKRQYLDNSDFILNEGDGVFINSNILHYIRAGTSEECILRCVEETG